jgi:parallel beta-helix repeat protein
MGRTVITVTTVNGCNMKYCKKAVAAWSVTLIAALFSTAAAALDPPTNVRVITAGDAECTKQVWQNLEACGWSGPANTGYSSGTTLRASQGRTISADNTVIDGEKITGGLVISAKNVIVRNSWIISSFGTGTTVNGTGVVKILSGASATIDHCTLDGSNRTHAGVWFEGANLVVRGNNIFGINDGIFVWDADNFIVEDNYLHGFTDQTANGHIDGFQTEGASHGIIRHNTFDVTQDQDSAVAIWNSRRNSDDILVENNLMAGGGFTVYAEDYSPSEQSPAGGYSVTNVIFSNNSFSTVHYPCVGNWGVWFTRGAPTDGWHRNGNTVVESAQNLDANNPIVNGVECR